MAPTGRAAKRLEEQSGEQASTVHRALEANFARNGRGFARNEDNPLEADVIIIDEVSMLDVFLMSSLLKAVEYGTRLILVGDKDQLPSVGAGNVLADIIASDIFKVVELTQIYRQSEDSMISTNAHKINHSEMPDLKAKSSDFFYSSTSDPQAVANEIVSLISERMPKYFKDITSDDIQVITPMKAGLCSYVPAPLTLPPVPAVSFTVYVFFVNVAVKSTAPVTVIVRLALVLPSLHLVKL